MSNTGIFSLNTKDRSNTNVLLFVRADYWYYHDRSDKLLKAAEPFKGNPDLSLVAPLILGSFKYD